MSADPAVSRALTWVRGANRLAPRSTGTAQQHCESCWGSMDRDFVTMRGWCHAGWRPAGLVLPAVARLVVCIVGAAVLVGAPATANGRGWVATTTRVGSTSIPGVFAAVADTSASDVWAVGHTAVGDGQTLVAHWNGAAWASVPSPSPGSFASLAGVAATAATDAWAVGWASLTPQSSPNLHALILHWDGVRWTQVAVPALGSDSELRAVAATSAGNAWAVGSAGSHALILHWDGSTWTQMLGPGGELGGVAASSGSNAWAVGSTKGRTLTLHWNGRAWTRVPSPSPRPEGLTDFLNSVAIGPGNAAWAVGTISCGCGPGPSLIERWNGRSWRVARSPTAGGGPDLAGVVSVSARDAWAVGRTGSGDGPEKTAILHWNGLAWKHVTAPSPDPSASLAALALVSPGDIWAVGSGSDRKRTRFTTVLLHWNGTVWR
jgi:hypothetical protein